MDPEIKAAFEAQDKKLDAVFKSSEKLRKYFKWTLIITIVTIFLPLLGLLFVIPQFFSYYQNLGNLGL